MNVDPQNSEFLIQAALSEDLKDRGDITTLAVGKKTDTHAACIYAKQHGVLAGLAIAEKTFLHMDPSIQFQFILDDACAVTPGQKIAVVHGPVHAILEGERTALNFIGRLSGIATATANFVHEIKGTDAVILDTRKTTPGWRLLEKYAVRCGGGQNHRMGLYDMFLIKDNHITTAGGISPAVNRCRNYMDRMGFRVAIEVETVDVEGVRKALACGVDRIMLDNMPVEQIRRCVLLVNGKIPLEASGNVTLENVRQIALTGVDYISTGFITHSAASFDISLLLE